jgi:hypothetical protein
MRIPNGVELWSPDQPPTHAGLLTKSADEISLLSLGHRDSQPVTLIGIDSPALEWALRNHNVEIVSALDPLNAPPIVVTPMMDELGLPSAYRGQDFIWRQPPLWDTIKAPDWVRWLVYRQLPRETETVILWARDDLFPDAREDVQPYYCRGRASPVVVIHNIGGGPACKQNIHAKQKHPSIIAATGRVRKSTLG